jgi:hypothetical protein
MPNPKKLLDALYGAKPPVSRLSMSHKDVVKRVPNLTEAMKAVQRGEMSVEEYYKLVDALKPVTPYGFVPKPVTAEEALAALGRDKAETFGRTDLLTPGETILSRLDIPAYSGKGAWVTSQHRHKPPEGGPRTIYTPTMVLEGETKMLPGTGAAKKYAAGQSDKSSWATMRGAYKPMSDEDAVAMAQDALMRKDFAQIGYDPERRGHFYDRKTMRPIIGTEEGLIQIGPLVLGKKPVYGDPGDFEYKDGGAVRMQGGGDPAEQMFNFNPMAAQAARQERMRREAEEAKRYKSVMGTTPQDLLRRVEPPPAEMSALPLSQTPTTLDRLARSGLEALGVPKPRAQSITSNVKGAVEMLVPDPERIYREMSEATEERDPAKFALANLEAGLGYMPFAKPAIGAAKAIGSTALDVGKVAGREALRPIDQAMFGEGPLAGVLNYAAPLQAVPKAQAPVSPLGFYNPVEQAALNVQRKQGPGQAFLNELQRGENVSKDFLQSSGLAERLAAMPNVTREEVQAMTKGTVPEVQQVMLGETVVPPHAKEWLKVHMPEFDPSDVSQIDEAIALANQRYDKLVNEGDLGLAEFAADAIDDLMEMKKQYKPGTKAAEALSKYGQYTIPGGENYREMLLTLPTSQPTDRDGLAQLLYGRSFDDLDVNQAARVMNELSSPTDGKTYRSTHWSQPNVLSHVRMNDRTDAEGKKVLFIEELQSDWAQEGRKKGFVPKDIDEQLKKGEERFRERTKEIEKISARMQEVPGGSPEWEELSKQRQALYDKQGEESDWGNRLLDTRREGIPSAPFVQNTKDWVDLSLKNILKRAVDEGYDRVAFINGKQSADRFRLSNHVSSIEWNPPGDRLQQKGADGFVTIYLQNNNPVELPLTREGKVLEGIGTQFDGKDLDEIVGKEVAQKIMASPSGSLAGEGLSIGGTGMKKFYDEIVPERVRKLVGKNSLRDIQFEDKTAKLREELASATPGSSRYLYLTDKIGQLERDAERYGALGNQLGFDITPEIREKFSKPIPYKKGGAVSISDNPDVMALEVTMATGGAVHMQAGGNPMDEYQPPINPFAAKALQQQRMREEIERRRAEEQARQQTPLDTSLPGPSPRRPALPGLQDLKGAFERRVAPVISEAKQTALTGGILGDILRAYGEYSVPANQAMSTALGRPFEQEFPPEEPPGMTVPTAFERGGDFPQQLLGGVIGDPANLLDPGIMRSIGAGAKSLKPFAKQTAEMVGEMAMKGVPGMEGTALRMGILPESPKFPEAAEAVEAKPFTGKIKNERELIEQRGQTPASIERAENAMNSGQRVFRVDERGKAIPVLDINELASASPESLRIVNISPQEFEAVQLGAGRNADAQRSMLDQIEGLHKDFAPEEGWAPLNIVKAEIKTDKAKKPIINRQTGLPMTEVEAAKIPYNFHLPPEDMPREAWEDTIAARITDEVDGVLARAKSGDQEAIDILKEAAWYRAMRDRLRSEFGGIGDVFADVLGTTSAQTGVEQNFDNAIEILRRFSRGDYDKELLAYEKRLRAGESVDGTMLTRMFRNNEFPLITKAGGQLFNANSPSSMGALLDMFRAIKAGDSPKTPNFTGNLIGLTNEATIDVWAARMLRRLADLPRIPPAAEKGVAGKHLVGSTLYQPKVGGEFGFGQNVFRRAADELNAAGLLKEYDPIIGDLGPDDLQAIAWFIEKELWTKNKWTTKAGEGGSLDYEMSFAGAPDSQKVKELRRDINTAFSPPAKRKTESDEEYAKRVNELRTGFETDKANKLQQLKDMKADVDRYRLGVSGERPGKPMSDYGQAELASEFDDVVRDDPSVVTYNLTSTLGSFMGDTERALNAEFVTRSDFNPLPLERRLVEQGKYYDQDAVFISKAVPFGAPNARPGVEIYFKQKLTPQDMAKVTERLRSYGVDGFTYITDMRLENRPNLRVTTQASQNKTFRPFAEDLRPEPGSSGITFQYIPEFDDAFDPANAAAIMQQRRQVFNQVVADLLEDGNVSDARLSNFDTKVFFRGDYDDYLARATGPSYQAPRAKQQAGPNDQKSDTRGKNQQKLQRAISDRVREEATGKTLTPANKKKPTGKAAGGRVRLSDNLDTMMLELMRNKRYGH